MFRLVAFITTVLAATAGGKVTHISKHPYEVSVQFKNCDDCPFVHGCVGAILNSTVILATAHCLNGKVAEDIQVVAGLNNIGEHGVTSPVKRFVAHEHFSLMLANENDIAVLFLGAELPVDQINIKAIQLITGEPSGGEKAIATGWRTGQIEANVRTISTDDCDERLGGMMVESSMLCADWRRTAKNSCETYSGGSLVVNGALAGLYSWAFCGKPYKLSVYSNVGHLRPWIDGVLSA